MSHQAPTIRSPVQSDFSCVQVVISLLTLISIVVSTLLIINDRLQRRRLAQRAEQKRHDVLQGVTLIRQQLESCSMSFDELITIGQYSLPVLQNKLRDMSLRPLEILRAFQYKALLLYDAGNSGICQFIEEAEELAESIESDLDRLLDKYPLAGIPISVKELCAIESYDTTFGLAKRCGHPSNIDCILVQMLKACGTIPFVITAAGFMGYDMTGYNPIFGNIGNPYSLSHYPGGSSTGECVLIAQGGSLIGVGKDKLGSVRVPASACGVAALKPSKTRISPRGCVPINNSSVFGIETVIGPIGFTVDSLVDFMRTILAQPLFDLDHHVLPLVFDESMLNDTRKLKIGVYYTLEHEKLTQSTPSVRDIVQKSVGLLHQLGHRTVPFYPPKIGHARTLFYKCVFAGGEGENINMMSYETLNQPSFTVRLFTSLPVPISRACFFTLNALKALMRGDFCCLIDILTSTNAFNLIQQVDAYRKEFTRAWNLAGLDALICPGLPFPAPPKSVNPKLVANAVLHTGLYGLVDYPSGVLPMGFVDKSIISQVDHRSTTQLPEHMDQLCVGLPLSLQVVASPCQDELLLRLMRELESANRK